VEQINGAVDTEAKDEESGISLLDLLRRQAQWLLDNGEFKAAAEMFWAAKEHSTCIIILGDHNWLDDLIEKVRQLPKTAKKHLAQAAACFRKAGHHKYAKETYLKMDDIKSLMNVCFTHSLPFPSLF
jgi:intraflagellar transport protein 122